MAETKVPSIPTPPSSTDPAVRRWMDAVKQALDVRLGQRGDKLDAAITWRQLAGTGAITVRGQTIGTTYTIPGYGPIQGVTPGGSSPVVDLTPPGAPTGLTANGAFTSILLQWTTVAGRDDIAYTEVWRNAVDDLGTAVLIGTSNFEVYSDPVDPAQTYYYWVRHVSNADVRGAYNATPGTAGASAGLISQHLQNLMITAAKIADDAVEAQHIANAAVGSAAIANAAIQNAHIQDAQITSAKIASLAADKISAGSITAAVSMTALTFNGGSMDIGSGKFTVDTLGNVDARSITIRDTLGNVLLSSGAGFSGLGALATLDQVSSTYIANAAIQNAHIGDAQITAAKIGTAQVGTLQIAGQAVTIPTAHTLFGLTTTASAAWVGIFGTWYALAQWDAPLLVTFSGVVYCEAQGGAGQKAIANLRLVVNGSVVATAPYLVESNTSNPSNPRRCFFCFQYKYQPYTSAGLYYEIQMHRTFASGIAGVVGLEARTISFLELKR